MTPLPPLHFIDGSRFYGHPCQALIFDNSCLEDWQTCKRLYQYKDLERKAPTTEQAGRNFGSACHRAWEYRYKTVGAGRVDDACAAGMNAALAKYFSESPSPAGDFRTLDHAQRYIAEYNNIYPFEPWSVLTNAKGEPFVEQTFALPFGEVSIKGFDPLVGDLYRKVKIVYAGKIDLAIKQDDEWTLDHKTTFQLGPTFTQDMEQNGGQTGYVWAFRESLGRKPRGFIINACRVRRPSRSAQFDGAVPIDASDFLRIPVDVSDSAIDDWRQDTLALIEEILWCHARGYMPRHRKACVGKYGPCDFLPVCSVQKEARQQILESNLFEDNDWTPLNRPQ